MATLSKACLPAALSLLLPLLLSAQVALGQAAERLSGAEIEALLADGRFEGTWREAPYGQSFTASGSTWFAFSGERESFGRWVADQRQDLYCSQWPPSTHWDCYQIWREVDGERWYWREVDGEGQALGPDEPFWRAPPLNGESG